MKNFQLLTLILTISVTGIIVIGEEKSQDNAYFLSWQQKMELISNGEITDDNKNVYDVWLCPGYVYPTEFARDEGWKEGTEAFSEYFQAKKYQDLSRHSGDCLKWAWEDCILDGLIEGVPQAWDKNFSRASGITEKRVFGWFLAYPTAFFLALIDNTFRIPVTLIGSVLGTTSGVAIVPTYYALNSGIEGTSRYLVPGTIIPISGYTLNTIVSPPLALLGQRPNESRVDGFWVSMRKAQDIAKDKHISKPLSSDEKKIYAEWAVNVQTKLKPFESKTEELKSELQNKRKDLYRQIEELSKAYRKKQQALDLEKEKTWQKTLEFKDNKIDPERLLKHWNDIKKCLVKQGLQKGDIDKIRKQISKNIRTTSQVRRHYRRRNTIPIKNYRKADPTVESLNKPDDIIREID